MPSHRQRPTPRLGNNLCDATRQMPQLHPPTIVRRTRLLANPWVQVGACKSEYSHARIEALSSRKDYWTSSQDNRWPRSTRSAAADSRTRQSRLRLAFSLQSVGSALSDARYSTLL